MNTRALIPLMPMLMGCLVIDTNTDLGDDDSTSGDGDGEPTGDGDGDPTGDGDGDPTGDGDGDGDGDPEWCGLSEDPPTDQPWFTLSQFGAPLEDGGELAVECGFQGFFMIEFYPTIGGFIPASDHVPFSVTLDVEGFNLNPNGHFAESDPEVFVACCDDPYGYCYETYTLRLYPPDMISDLSVIHGAPGLLTVTMTAPGDPVEQVLDVTMFAMEMDTEWEFCEYYYPNVDPLPIDGPPIPQ